MLQFGLFSFFSVDIRKIETSSTQIQMMKNSSVFACAWNDRTSSRSLNIADGFFSFFFSRFSPCIHPSGKRSAYDRIHDAVRVCVWHIHFVSVYFNWIVDSLCERDILHLNFQQLLHFNARSSLKCNKRCIYIQSIHTLPDVANNNNWINEAKALLLFFKDQAICWTVRNFLFSIQLIPEIKFNGIAQFLQVFCSSN